MSKRREDESVQIDRVQAAQFFRDPISQANWKKEAEEHEPARVLA
jgi:hypothetical protein